MKRSFIVMLTATALLAAALAIPHAQAQKSGDKILWRADSIFPATHRVQRELLDPWAAEIAKRSNGRLDIKWFPGGQLALGSANALRVLQARSVDVVALIYSAASGDMPALAFPSLPLLFAGEGAAGVHRMWQNTRPIWERELAKWGVAPVLFYMADEQILYNSKRPLEKLDDIKGLKVRFYSREHAQFLQKLGAIPTSIPYNEIVSAAQRGVIDGVITGGYTGVSFSFWDARQKYALTDFGIDYVPLIVGMSLKAWKELPPDLQAVVREVSKETEAKTVEIVNAIQADSWKILQSHGIVLSRFSPADVTRAKAMAKEVADAWVATVEGIGKELMDAAGKGK